MNSSWRTNPSPCMTKRVWMGFPFLLRRWRGVHCSLLSPPLSAALLSYFLLPHLPIRTGNRPVTVCCTSCMLRWTGRSWGASVCQVHTVHHPSHTDCTQWDSEDKGQDPHGIISTCCTAKIGACIADQL